MSQTLQLAKALLGLLVVVTALALPIVILVVLGSLLEQIARVLSG